MDTEELVLSAQESLAEAADGDKAIAMAAYMKTDMPFYGVQKPGRSPILKHLVRSFPPKDHDSYVANVTSMWDLVHREEKYLAIGYARAFPEFVTMASLGVYTKMILEGAWWDFVDEIAIKLVGCVLHSEPSLAAPLVRSWIESEDLWLRRTSIICQLGAKSQTDTALLNEACTANVGRSEFFIRKAIGWALRDYAKTDPEWVRAYVASTADSMSGLTHREATKHL